MRLLNVPTKSIRPYILTEPRFLATYSLKERFSLYIVQFPFSSCPAIDRDAKRAAFGRKDMAPEPALIVTQHAVGRRKFIFLATQCCYVVTQLRPGGYSPPITI